MDKTKAMEVSDELKKKINRVLGIPLAEIDEYEPAELIDELCDTVIMLDEERLVPLMTQLREKLTSINARIWNLLGEHDPKKVRENLNGIAELERYVGELKRRVQEVEKTQVSGQEELAAIKEENENYREQIRQFKERVTVLESQLEQLLSTLAEEEMAEEEGSGEEGNTGSQSPS